MHRRHKGPVTTRLETLLVARRTVLRNGHAKALDRASSATALRFDMGDRTDAAGPDRGGGTFPYIAVTSRVPSCADHSDTLDQFFRGRSRDKDNGVTPG